MADLLSIVVPSPPLHRSTENASTVDQGQPKDHVILDWYRANHIEQLRDIVQRPVACMYICTSLRLIRLLQPYVPREYLKVRGST